MHSNLQVHICIDIYVLPTITPRPISVRPLPLPSDHSFLNQICSSCAKGRQRPVTPSVLRVSMGGGDHLYFGGSHARFLFDNAIKKAVTNDLAKRGVALIE
ncbi:hypothetical protein EVAR_41647_1 [Eumeta japonica]|uniref:Uncharacterized protein n=1 Tax=Eumeta variegata TaxID=151549 RepID=A0A4C1WZI8_EUMVA|nr:hypothetical protein EVAR_41647_1 [Eumeta japonica]